VEHRLGDLVTTGVAQGDGNIELGAVAVRGTGASPTAVIVPRAFFVYSISIPLTMNRASSAGST